MQRKLLDTNVIIRFLLRDVESQYKQAYLWFKEAEQRAFTVVITPLVLAETCYVLSSFYKQDRETISATLNTFIEQPWMEVEEKAAIIATWPHYRAGLHFVDSFLLARAEVYDEDILTFDRQLQKRVKKMYE
jgi:predicted nucleic-acid-binding protein